MNKQTLLYCIYAVVCALAFTGCDDDDECKEYAIDSLYQTFWQGTYESNGENLNIQIGFTDKEYGMYKLEGEETEGFSYTHAEKRVSISERKHKLSGDWYITTATNKTLVLKQNLFDEKPKTNYINKQIK